MNDSSCPEAEVVAFVEKLLNELRNDPTADLQHRKLAAKVGFQPAYFHLYDLPIAAASILGHIVLLSALFLP